MPIRPEWRHLYRGPEWQATRERILARAGNHCEACGLKNGLRGWRDASGRFHVWRKKKPPTTKKLTTIQVGVAHLNHFPPDMDDSNLAALCRRCHLRHDAVHHAIMARRTRQAKKDARRPLLAQLAAAS